MRRKQKVKYELIYSNKNLDTNQERFTSNVEMLLYNKHFLNKP
jgi:hypothetical protein